MERLHVHQIRTRSSLVAPPGGDGGMNTTYSQRLGLGTCLVLWGGGETLIWVLGLAQFITCFVTLRKTFIFSRVSTSSNYKMNGGFLLHS